MDDLELTELDDPSWRDTMALAADLMVAHEDLPLVIIATAIWEARSGVGEAGDPAAVRGQAERLLTDPAWQERALAHHGAERGGSRSRPPVPLPSPREPEGAKAAARHGRSRRGG